MKRNINLFAAGAILALALTSCFGGGGVTVNSEKTQLYVGVYEGGLVENGDKGLLCDEVDQWLQDSARKSGDCEIIHNAEKGYYIVYYVGDGLLKWQSSANETLVNNACEEEYKTFEEKYEISDFSKKAIQLIKEVDMSYVAETTAAQ